MKDRLTCDLETSKHRQMQFMKKWMRERIELEKKLIETKNQLTSQLMKPIMSNGKDQEMEDQDEEKCKANGQ